MQFARDPDCRACPLHEGCRSVCIPTRGVVPSGTPPKPWAVLVVGEKPGAHEDRTGRHFAHRAGRYLQAVYIEAFELHHLADFYLTNAVRCKPPQDSSPTRTQLKACRRYIEADLDALRSVYGNKVVIWCLGASAIQSVLSLPTVKAGIRHQGRMAELAGVYYRVFCSYNPAVLDPRRDPSKVAYVKRHLRLLRDFFNGRAQFDESLAMTPSVAPHPPSTPVDRLVVDIETYGILRHNVQTQFHPRKSVAWDNVSASDLIVTVHLTYKGETPPLEPPRLEHAVFRWQDPSHRHRLVNHIRHLIHSSGELIGMNLLFDLQYLRFCCPVLARLLDHPQLVVRDLAVLNYLYAEDRPERSLKQLSELYQVSSYPGGFTRYRADDDPDLWSYGTQDTYSTWCLFHLIEREIALEYGPDSPKLSPYTVNWYSELLWSLVWMSESGIPIDVPRLQALHDRLGRRLRALRGTYTLRYDAPLSGKGSGAHIRSVIEGGVARFDLLDHPNLALTGVRKQISTGQGNVQLLLDTAPRSDPLRRQIRTLDRYRRLQKIHSTYTRPILETVKRGSRYDSRSRHIDGVVYPTWYPVPSLFSQTQETGESEGGTNQARITCQHPSRQTWPAVMHTILTSTHRPGYCLHVDYSQLELRVAALLSGDPAMISEYNSGTDRHAAMARLIFGPGIDSDPRFRTLRQAGKTQNFRLMFGGGAAKMQQSVYDDTGILLSLPRCREIDDAIRHRYAALFSWQEAQVARAVHHRRLEIPLIGQSRRFLGSEQAVLDTYKTVMLNFPIQATAALICQSAQFHLQLALRARRFRSAVVCNEYDAIDVHGPLRELPVVTSLVQDILPRPPFLADLEAHLHRSCKMDIDVSVRTHPGTPNNGP